MLTKEQIIKHLKDDMSWELPEDATADDLLLFEEAHSEVLKLKEKELAGNTNTAKKIEDDFFEERLEMLEEFDAFDVDSGPDTKEE